jgi:uncharacterized protein
VTSRAPVVTLAVLGTYTCLRSAALPDGWHDAATTAMILVVAGLAAATSLQARELGLERRRIGPGLRWGTTVAAAVLAVVALALAAAPSLADRIADDLDTTTRAALVDALVRIPVATVVLEELAFRGVLEAQLRRTTSASRAAAVGVGAFALWHVPGAWSQGAVGVVGVVAATAVAGATFLALRRCSGSLAAPALVHWATNGGSLLLAVWLT